MDLPFDSDDILGAYRFGALVDSRVHILMKDCLRVAGAVAHIDKDDGAVIAAAVGPAHQEDFLSGMFGAEFTAHVSAAKVA